MQSGSDCFANNSFFSNSKVKDKSHSNQIKGREKLVEFNVYFWPGNYIGDSVTVMP